MQGLFQNLHKNVRNSKCFQKIFFTTFTPCSKRVSEIFIFYIKNESF